MWSPIDIIQIDIEAIVAERFLIDDVTYTNGVRVGKE